MTTIKLDLPCWTCGKTVEHTITVESRWSAPKAHVAGDRICATPTRVTQQVLDALLDHHEPEPLPCPDCLDATGECRRDCPSGGGL